MSLSTNSAEAANHAAAKRFPFPAGIELSTTDAGRILEARRIYAEGWVSRPTGVYTEHLEKILILLEKTVQNHNAEFTRAQVHILLVDFLKTFLPNADKHIPGLIEKQADEFMGGMPVFEISRPKAFSPLELREHLFGILSRAKYEPWKEKELVDDYLKYHRIEVAL